MRRALSLPPPLYNCIKVDMIVNIVSHEIDGNYEPWKYVAKNGVYGVAISLPQGVFQTTWGNKVFWEC